MVVSVATPHEPSGVPCFAVQVHNQKNMEFHSNFFYYSPEHHFDMILRTALIQKEREKNRSRSS